MTDVTRHDPFVVLSDAAMIADAKAQRLYAAEQTSRAMQTLRLCDLLAWSLAAAVPVTMMTRSAGQVCGRAGHVAAQFVMIEETHPVPRIVLVPTKEIVTVALQHLTVEDVGDPDPLDDVTTLLTMLETSYRGDAVELILTNGVTLCAPVRAFGDDVLLLHGTAETVLCVASGQVALAAIPPPRHPDRSHTGD
ncbi:MAG: hypothetical protein WD360_05130 [Nitriliruptoraceae bacterium]